MAALIFGDNNRGDRVVGYCGMEKRTIVIVILRDEK
jgi:hypothetical protein